jgi:hypothetical protein
MNIGANLTVTAPRVADRPTIDGQLSESCWDQADLPDSARIRFRPPTRYYREHWDRMRRQENLTDWYILCHDDENLYVAFLDTPDEDRRGNAAAWSARAETRDDPRIGGDHHYGLYLSDADADTVVLLRASASGAQGDALFADRDSAEGDTSWDGEWQSAVTADAEGFRAEFAIPWDTLRSVGIDRETAAINLFARTEVISYGVKFLLYPGRHERGRCENFTHVGLGESPQVPARSFTVRLHFAECDEVAAGERVFDIAIQGTPVLTSFDVIKAAGGKNKAVIREFKGIKATDEIEVVFTPRDPTPDARTAPILSGIQIRDEAYTPPTPQTRGFAGITP